MKISSNICFITPVAFSWLHVYREGLEIRKPVQEIVWKIENQYIKHSFFKFLTNFHLNKEKLYFLKTKNLKRLLQHPDQLL